MAMYLEDLDIEVLIQQVKDYPEIWNMKSEEHKDKQKRDASWQIVAKNVIKNFENKDTREKNEIVRILTSKWRNVRDTYFKSQKKRAGKISRRRQYIYTKHLSFLESIVDVTSQNTIKDDIDKSQTFDSSRNIKKTIKQSDDQEVQSTSTQKSNNNPQISKNEFEGVFLKFMEQSITIKPVDEDQAFFDSILPTVRNLNVDQKLDFRFEVLNILRTIKQGVEFEPHNQ